MGERVYEFTDRLFDEGYTGRWRYRVVERDVGTLYGKRFFSLLFKRRTDAVLFRVQCEVNGPKAAARVLDNSGISLTGGNIKIEASQ